MAERIIYGLAANLLTKVTSSAFQKIGLAYNVEDELIKLADTLSTINGVLADAEEKQEKSQAVKIWIRRLEQVVYDAEDLLDGLAYEELRQKVDYTMAMQVSDFFSSSSNPVAFSLNMGLAIKEIRRRLDEIGNEISKFGLIILYPVANMQFVGNRERETDSFVIKPNIIGRKKETEEIIEMLIGSTSTEKDFVIPIVGIGGLGKTALAKLLFNDERVVQHFEPRIWVCVSEVFDRGLIVRDILGCEKSEHITLENLHSRLRRKLEGKRYLLVLDDVWNEDNERWNELEQRLTLGASGSKIVVTTRSVKVTCAMNITSPYILHGLTDKQSWELFEKLASSKRLEKLMNSNLIEIGMKLIKRCKGVPLAIKTLGSMMLLKTSESEWLSIQNNANWSLSPVDSVLKLSYDRLPDHLKLCFMYCSIFPKDFEIQHEVLIQLWIAQGYVHSTERSQNLEEIGDDYVKDFMSISFFQDVEVDDFQNITSFKMHDLVHDLAINVAGTNCYSIAENEAKNINFERVHHMSLQCHELEKLPEQLLKAKGMRTFFLISYWDGWESGHLNQRTIMSNFTYLRVLDLNYCGIKKMQSSIGMLKHLRYLDFSSNYEMKGLPNSISNLLNLQTLKLSDCQSLEKLPRDITKLINLRCLMIDGNSRLTHMPSGLGKLTSLQRLPLFVVGKAKRENSHCYGLCELNCLNDLRGKLCIVNLRNVRLDDAISESKEANMKEKQYLQSLRLEWKIMEPDTSWNEENSGEDSDADGSEENSGEDSDAGSDADGNEENSAEDSDAGSDADRSEDYSGEDSDTDESEEHDVDKPDADGREEHAAAELVLEGLQPHPNLRELEISSWYKGLRFPSWMMKMGNVVRITIEECHSFQQLQPLDQLPYLKFLSLSKLTVLEYIQDDYNKEARDGKPSTCSSSALVFFPSLEEVNLASLPKLKGWWRKRESVVSSSIKTKIKEEEESSSSSSSSSLVFSKLTKLSVSYCCMLTSMPLHPNLEELHLYEVSEKLLRERLTTAKSRVSHHHQMPSSSCSIPSSSSSSSSSSFLSRLKSLFIGKIMDLRSLPLEGLQNLTSLKSLKISFCPILFALTSSGDGFINLTSLTSLVIWECRNLRSLSKEVRHLTNLEDLEIHACPELELSDDDDGMHWQSLRSLRKLEISKIPKLVTLPVGIQHLTTLQHLQIHDCPELELSDDDDDGIQWQGLTSLCKLVISYIPKLVTLPVWIQHLTTLQQLRIDGCHELLTVPEWIGNLTLLRQLKFSHCHKLTSLPQETRHLSALQELDIYECHNLCWKRCNKETGEDWPTLRTSPI